MYLLEEKNIPLLPELMVDVSDLKDFKRIVYEHLEVVNEVLRDEFDSYDDPLKYIELKDYTDTIIDFMRLL